MLMGNDVQVHAFLQGMISNHEANLKKEKTGAEKGRRRNLKNPKYSAIHGYGWR